MSTVQDTPRVGTRTFFVGAVVVCLLVAAVASFYASAHPDGLEFVAEQTGFLHDSATAGSPFADYQTSGIDNPRLSGGLAGALGVAVMLLLSGALFWSLRRRGQSHDAAA